MNRAQKIENLFKLVTGQMKPDELKPKRLCMAIGYRSTPIYTINEKEVTEAEFNKYAKIEPAEYGTGVFNVTYGEFDEYEAITGKPGNQYDDDEE